MHKNFFFKNDCNFLIKYSFIEYGRNNLGDDVYEQIKDFLYYRLTEEQSLLIDKLIKEHYKRCENDFFIIIVYHIRRFLELAKSA